MTVFFSPKLELTQAAVSGDFVAGVSALTRLIVRRLPSLSPVNVFTCVDKITFFAFSPDGSLIMAQIPSRGIVQIFAVEAKQETFSAQIDCGVSGLSGAMWAPDSVRILVASDFHVKLDIWCLHRRASVRKIKFPKFTQNACKTVAFAENRPLAALLLRTDCRDSLDITDTRDFSRVGVFPVASQDAAGVAFCAHDQRVVIWEGPLECRAFVYTLTGELINRIEPYMNRLGIKCFAHSTRFLAAGCFDDSVRIIAVTKSGASETAAFHVHDEVRGPAHAFREVMEGSQGQLHLLGASGLSGKVSYQVEKIESSSTLRLPSTKTFLALQAGSAPKVGISSMAFSPSGRYLATKSDAQASVLTVWDLGSFSLAVALVHRQPVRSFAWGESERLAIATGDSRVFFWLPGDSALEPMEMPESKSQLFPCFFFRNL